MIKEIVKICGLDKEEILSRLEKFEGFGVNFSVEEYCLDATIGMSSSAKRDVLCLTPVIICIRLESRD